MIPLEEFWQIFRRRFGRQPEVVARAPGRVNLIGEHTDYNDGFVLPVAIDREIWVGVAGREDRLLNGFSLEHESFAQISLDSLSRGGKSSWIDYPAGVAHQLLSRSLPLPGTDLLIAGDVPVGAGLSSSAALLVASATAWKHLCKWNLSQREIIQICKQAENEYVGVACGIMDQYVSCAGRKGHALFIDCRDLASKAVPLPGALSILVCDTGVRRELATSEYNRRRAECEEGVRLLKKYLGDIRALRDITPDQLEKYQDRLPEVTARRCRHVVRENARVLEALDALAAGDSGKFGRLMNESHESLRRDYEVSCPELDAMVELAGKEPGVLGARMTGAGFGGCTVNVVESEFAERAARAIQSDYNRLFSRPAATYVCAASDGASILMTNVE